MSLYLKYRPRDFHSLVGQHFIKQTLQNALKENKLVGAYLFTGPRGTGKTSTARILALGMNCLGKEKPCYQCEICTQFQEGKLTDIIEIDAASNTGVDNIREIIERAQFVPNKTTYKVYIIDEVHMLSKGAFNALLKILEEPPSHVKFILATTEIHKVPETILSRCQRYDFKSITDNDVKDRLSFIAREESIDIDDKSLAYIIKNARGGLRNAINLFEQLVIGNRIEYTYIIENLGITEHEIIENIAHKLLSNDTSVIFDFQNLVEGGKNIRLFYKDLIFFVREMMIQTLQKKDPISKYIQVIESLDEAYIKSKNSFDEYTTLLTGILKIIDDIPKEKEKTKIEPIKPILQKSEPVGTITPSIQQEAKIVEPKESSLSIDDMQNLFGSDGSINNESSGIFDKDIFITKLKESGAKGAIIISLKGASFQLIGNNLQIKTASSIALKSLEVDKNIGLYNTILANMGLNDIQLSF